MVDQELAEKRRWAQAEVDRLAEVLQNLEALNASEIGKQAARAELQKAKDALAAIDEPGDTTDEVLTLVDDPAAAAADAPATEDAPPSAEAPTDPAAAEPEAPNPAPSELLD